MSRDSLSHRVAITLNHSSIARTRSPTRQTRFQRGWRDMTVRQSHLGCRPSATMIRGVHVSIYHGETLFQGEIVSLPIPRTRATRGRRVAPWSRQLAQQAKGRDSPMATSHAWKLSKVLHARHPKIDVGDGDAASKQRCSDDSRRSLLAVIVDDGLALPLSMLACVGQQCEGGKGEREKHFSPRALRRDADHYPPSTQRKANDRRSGRRHAQSRSPCRKNPALVSSRLVVCPRRSPHGDARGGGRAQRCWWTLGVGRGLRLSWADGPLLDTGHAWNSRLDRKDARRPLRVSL